MEALDSSRSHSFGPLTLYKDDVLKIIDLLDDNISGFHFVIGEFVFEDAADYQKNLFTHAVFKASFSGYNPTFSFDIGKGRNILYISSSKLQASGLYLKVIEIINAAERKPKLLYSYACPNIVSFFAMAISMLKYYLFFPVTIPLLVMGVIWTIFIAYCKTERSAVIYPYNRAESKNYISRYGETIIISLISTVIGGIIVALAIKIFRISP